MNLIIKKIWNSVILVYVELLNDVRMIVVIRNRVIIHQRRENNE